MLGHTTSEAAAAVLAAIVIPATPITTQPRPIHAVGDRVSPRKTTPSATPIGTRRYACAVVPTEPSVWISRKYSTNASAGENTASASSASAELMDGARVHGRSTTKPT